MIPPQHGGEGGLLAVGTRIRHKRHPELTGRVQAIEWQATGEPSGIPYYVAWDDSDRAYDKLGWFWIYASEHSIEVSPANPLARTPAPTTSKELLCEPKPPTES